MHEQTQRGARLLKANMRLGLRGRNGAATLHYPSHAIGRTQREDMAANPNPLDRRIIVSASTSQICCFPCASLSLPVFRELALSLSCSQYAGGSCKCGT